MKALLLAGGQATRLYPFTKTRPKPLLPIANQTLIKRNLLALAEAGITSVVVVHAKGDSSIRSAIGPRVDSALHVEYVEQQGEGIGDAVLSAKEKFISGQYILLGYADILSTSNIYSHILSVFNHMRSPVASVNLVSESTRNYGNVYLDEKMCIDRIVEKPHERNLGNYILGGVYMMPYQLFEMLEKNEKNMLAAFDQVIAEFGLHAAIWEKDWIDINYPWSILHANAMVMNTLDESRIAADVKIPTSATVSGPVIIGKGVTLCEGVVLRGPCIIGENSFIGNNVLVRENTVIGANTEIGYGTELKNAVIFGDAIIGRISYIGDSVVGYGAHIGSGTMTINCPVSVEEVFVPVRGELKNTGLRKLGAFIGDNALIGASNTIRAGAVIDSGAIIRDHFTVDREEA